MARHAGVEESELATPEGLRRVADKLGLDLDPKLGHGKLLVEIFEHLVEPRLIQPTFVTGYPLEVSPLARRNDSNPALVDRFELFIGGKELANAFSELKRSGRSAAAVRRTGPPPGGPATTPACEVGRGLRARTGVRHASGRRRGHRH